MGTRKRRDEPAAVLIIPSGDCQQERAEESPVYLARQERRRVRCASLPPPMGRIVRCFVVGALVSGAWLGAAHAAAVVAPAGPGQQALAVAVTKQGIVAKLCARETGCSADGGTSLAVPEDVMPLLGQGSATIVPLAGGSHVVRVEVSGAEGAKWLMLIGAPVKSTEATPPTVVAKGWTDRMKGEPGEGKTTVVLEDGPPTARRLLVARRREDVTLCGRPTLVNVRALDPATMTLVGGVTVQNLSELERSKATRLAALRISGSAPARGAPQAVSGSEAPSKKAAVDGSDLAGSKGGDRAAAALRLGGALLHAEVGSSAVDKTIATLTDRDFETTWSEDRPGDGQGEFVTMSASSDVGITAVELAVRPSGRDGGEQASGREDAGRAPESIPDGAAPRTFYLATPDRVLHVTMPEDAWQKPGARYEVKLPEEIRTSCLAVVLDTAYAANRAQTARVTLAEISARTAFDGMAAPALVELLAGGGERARGAAALLARMGPEARKAAAVGYSKLDRAGKALAVGLIEAGPCEEHVPFFAERLGRAAVDAPPRQPGSNIERSPDVQAEVDHARDRLRRCGRVAAPKLATMLAEAPDTAKVIAASELALIAPAEAVPVLLAAITHARAKHAMRRALRTALAQAAKNPRAWSALRDELKANSFAARPEVVRVDLLRAIGPHLGRVEGSREALGSLATPAAPFWRKYLLLEPAAQLARAGDAGAEQFVRTALRNEANPHLRTHAAEVAAGIARLSSDLVVAADDAEVRVREAAVRSLGQTPGALMAAPSSVESALTRRLGSEPWTFVRSAAARALAGLPPNAAANAALAGALADASAEVRGAAVDALGARRAVAHVGEVRERAEDRHESLDVRAKAIAALAEMCDRSQLDRWTKLASRMTSPQSEEDQRLGIAAIAALGRVHPPDLQARLGSLLQKAAPAGSRPALAGSDAPRAVQEMARAAVAMSGSCPVR